MSAAVTTHEVDTVTTSIHVHTTPAHPVFPLPGTAHHGLLLYAGTAPALLPMAMIIGDASISSSCSGRNRLSRITLGLSCFAGCSLPPPTAAEDRAALLSDSRPAANALRRVVTVHPRPGPASLLTSLQRPQPGRATTLAGRVGHASRASGTGVSDVRACGLGLVHGPADAARQAMQEVIVPMRACAFPIGCRRGLAQRGLAAACICVATPLGHPSSGAKDEGKKETANSPGNRAVATPRAQRRGPSTPCPSGTVARSPPSLIARQDLPQPTPGAAWA